MLLPSPDNWTKLLRRCACPIFCLLFLLLMIVVFPLVLSNSLRTNYLHTIQRVVARAIPPKYVFAGDSLTEGIKLICALTCNPLSAVNLAQGGTSISQISLQVARARAYRSHYLFVMAGTNDIIIYHRSIVQIVDDYKFLLQQAPQGSTLIITLIPYTQFKQHNQEIGAANREIRKLVEGMGGETIDLNPYLASDGILNDAFTTDGIHFNERAYEIWIKQMIMRIKS